MHKILKKTIKYTACGIGVLLLVIILFVSILYFSADMLTPDYTPKANGELVQTDSLREYAGNYLRQPFLKKYPAIGFRESSSRRTGGGCEFIEYSFKFLFHVLLLFYKDR